jgi:ribosomal protein S18 acetylase RimI-like enzyme
VPSGLDRTQIRQIRANDLPALEWEGEFTHFRRLYAEAYRRSQRGLSVLWLAEIPGEEIVGQVFVQLTCDRPELCNGIDRAYLYAFRVRPAYRSAGVGARMLETLEDDLLLRGYQYLTLNVAQENHRAQSFYSRHSFNVVAPEPGRWSYIDHEGKIRDVIEPAWRMEKRLG